MKNLIAFTALAASVAAFADKAQFPYDTELTTRFATNAAVVVENATVSFPGEATPESDTIAKLTADGVAFTVVDGEDWEDFTNTLDGVAMLTVRDDGTATNWLGYTAGDWSVLTGVVYDADATYDVEFDFDKTAGGKVGYKVKPSEGSWIALCTNDVFWLAQGNASNRIVDVAISGVGSIASGALASGARAAWANITNIVQDYSFDYSNVVFTIKTGAGSYGEGAKIKVTLSCEGEEDKAIETTVSGAAQDYTFDFSGESLTPGKTYACVVQVVASGTTTPAGDFSADTGDVKLYTSADWFGFTEGAFVNAETNNVVIEEGAFLADDEDLPAVVTPVKAADANTLCSVETVVDYTNYGICEDFGAGQAALVLSEEGWMCKLAGEWTAITNDSVSTANGVYSTLAEFDYTVNPGKVRFSVKVGEAWQALRADAVEWFTLAGTSNRLEATAFIGDGKVAALAASYHAIGGAAPDIDEEKNEIVVSGSTVVDLSDDKLKAGEEYSIKSESGKKFNVMWDDKGDKYAKVVDGKLKVIEGTPKNGISSYDSFALGLDAETATSKPVIESAQNADTGKLTSPSRTSASTPSTPMFR